MIKYISSANKQGRMRSLILHANRFESRVNTPSNKPEGIVPDQKTASFEVMGEGILVFYCVEKQDTLDEANQLFDEVLRCCTDVKAKQVLIAPFVHLSNNIAPWSAVKDIHNYLLQRMAVTSLAVQTSHFGYHKSWLLDIKGHKYAYKYREFNPKEHTMHQPMPIISKE